MQFSFKLLTFKRLITSPELLDKFIAYVNNFYVKGRIAKCKVFAEKNPFEISCENIFLCVFNKKNWWKSFLKFFRLECFMVVILMFFIFSRSERKSVQKYQKSNYFLLKDVKTIISFEKKQKVSTNKKFSCKILIGFFS